MSNNNHKRIVFEDGTSMKYTNLHTWVYKEKGKASHCSIDKNHEAKRFEWANVSGQYKKDISDYIALCPSCHRKKDLKVETVEKCRARMWGVVYANKPIIQLTQDGKEVARYNSVIEAARSMGIVRSAISNCLTGLSVSSAGYKWIYE